MAGIGNINLKVLLLDTDFYALQAINGYLAWDRRTRVTFLAENPAQMWEHINSMPIAELPDVVVMDVDHFDNPEAFRETVRELQQKIADVMVICLAQYLNPRLIEIATETRTRAYMLKQEVRLQIAWAICYALDYDMVVTHSVGREHGLLIESRGVQPVILPEQREYPELTDRIRQAVKLCVIEGMPAHLAADEMGISLHTIRGYIKEGYRILESYDEAEYPVDMTPQERAFMRFTALAVEED